MLSPRKVRRRAGSPAGRRTAHRTAGRDLDRWAARSVRRTRTCRAAARSAAPRPGGALAHRWCDDRRERPERCTDAVTEDRHGRTAAARASCPAGRTGRPGRTTRPRTPGFRGYWYPVCFSSQVGEKPRAVTLLGERLVRHPRQRQGLRHEGPLPAPRRAAELRQQAVPRHGVLRLPRLDVRPGDR